MRTSGIQLFLLPYAGGRADAFAPLIACLDHFIEPIAVEYPGRGKRAGDPLPSGHEEFFQDVTEYVRRRRNAELPYALFGYSMGAAFAYEMVSREILDRPPAHLFFGARACIADEPIRELTDEEVLIHVKQLGGFDPKLMSNPRLFRVFTHPLLDDFHIAAQYRFAEGKHPDCGSTVLYSEEDTPFPAVKGWSQLTAGKTDFFAFSGSHFFMREHSQQIARIISEKLKECIE